MHIAILHPRSSGLDLCQAITDTGHDLVVISVGDHADQPDIVAGQATSVRERDINGAVRTLRAMRLDAVFAGSEESVTITNELAAELGLPHHSTRYTAARRDKYEMIRALECHGVPAPGTTSVAAIADIDPHTRFPVTVKPPASSGSDLVRTASDMPTLIGHVESILSTANRFGDRSPRTVIQEFLDGPMYVVNTVSRNGAHLVSDVYHKHVSYEGPIPISDSMILADPQLPVLRELLAYTFDCLDALGVANGPAHSEIIVTDFGPRLVEVNSRLMGPALPRDVFVPALGYSQATLTVESVTDLGTFVDRLDESYTTNRYVGQTQLRPHSDGRILRLTGLDHIRRLPGFAGIYKQPQYGQLITDRMLTTATTGIAYFRADNQAVVEDSINRARSLCNSGDVFGIEEAA